MKYTVNINQKAIVDMGITSLDFNDMAIIDFMVTFAHSKQCVKISYEDETYYWFSYTKIIEELPMLRIKTRQGINKKLDKLVDEGFIERYEENKSAKRSYFKFCPKLDKLFYSKNSYQDATNVAGEMQQTLQVTSNKRCMDNNTINNNTKDNNKTNKVCPSEGEIIETELEFEQATEESTDKEKTNSPIEESSSNNLLMSESNKVGNGAKADKSMDLFDVFRLEYKKEGGKARGLDTEYGNFKKKHKDYKEVSKIIGKCFENEMNDRNALKRRKATDPKTFIPELKNLSTYINQRSWEMYYNESFENKEENSKIVIENEDGSVNYDALGFK